MLLLMLLLLLVEAGEKQVLPERAAMVACVFVAGRVNYENRKE